MKDNFDEKYSTHDPCDLDGVDLNELIKETQKIEIYKSVLDASATTNFDNVYSKYEPCDLSEGFQRVR